MSCKHYNKERFDIGPMKERWFECIFCHTKFKKPKK